MNAMKRSQSGDCGWRCIAGAAPAAGASRSAPTARPSSTRSASSDGDKAIEMLSEPGPASSTIAAIKGETALTIAIARSDDRLDRLPARQGRRPQLARQAGDTPLIIAARIGFAEGVDWLLARGAKVDAANRMGETRADRRGPAAPGADRRSCCSRPAPIPTRPTMPPAIRRAIMPSATRAIGEMLKLIETVKPKPAKKPSPAPSLKLDISAVAERRVDLRRQPPRGAAGEAQQFGLAPRRRERAVRRLAHDRRVVAVGDDQPGLAGQEALLVAGSRPAPAAPPR